MDSANRKISDPNYVRLALSGLDELFTDQSGIIDVEELRSDQQNAAPPVVNNSRSDTMGAAEFLEHYFGVDTTAWELSECLSGQTERLDAKPVGNFQHPHSEQPAHMQEPLDIDITGGGGLDLTPLLDRLKEAHVQIQSAHYRIGFLEYEIDTYKDKMKLLEDVEARAARAAAVERENQELKKLLPLVEARANKVALVKRENEQLQVRIRELERKRGGVWSRFLGLFQPN